MKILRFLAIMLTALSMGTALAHLLEMPAKLGFDGQMWLFLLQKLYPPAFGTIGAVFEVGAVITVLVLLFLVRQRVPAFRWTLLGALCLIAAHAAFWFWVAPVNSTMLPLTSETLPADWTSLRNQWEYVHSARAGLQIIALAALILSILAEIPAGSFRNVRRRVRVPF